jgi:hypothetical protein
VHFNGIMLFEAKFPQTKPPPSTIALTRRTLVVVAESSGTKYFSMSTRGVNPSSSMSSGIFA